MSTHRQVMQRRSSQKAALTRAINSNQPGQIVEAVRSARREWDAQGYWPDDWTTWQRALDDALPCACLCIEDL